MVLGLNFEGLRFMVRFLLEEFARSFSQLVDRWVFIIFFLKCDVGTISLGLRSPFTERELSLVGWRFLIFSVDLKFIGNFKNFTRFSHGIMPCSWTFIDFASAMSICSCSLLWHAIFAIRRDGVISFTIIPNYRLPYCSLGSVISVTLRSVLLCSLTEGVLLLNNFYDVTFFQSFGV